MFSFCTHNDKEVKNRRLLLTTENFSSSLRKQVRGWGGVDKEY